MVPGPPVIAAPTYTALVAREPATHMETLRLWCEQVLGLPLGIAPLAGDASFRRYYRLSGCQPARLAVHAPPEKEKNLEFRRIAALLREAGVRAPAVLAHHEANGFLLIEDFGDRLLLPALSEDAVDGLYARALGTLLAVQRAPTAAPDWSLGDYSAALLAQEMALFPQWFLRELLGISPDPAEEALLAGLFGRLVDEALAQPQVFVHRDYHSRNLMLIEGDALGVIDFQDAVRGPVTYDLVSLLRDCYVSWPPARVEAWALGYAERAAAAGVMPAVEPATFLRWFDLMGLQRHIKVLGIFARLWLRDGKQGYLRDLPLVMRYTLAEADAHPDTRAFADWFRARVLPLARAQDWFGE